MYYNSIKHITTALYHAASNGWLKELCKCSKVQKSTGDSIEARLARALFGYQITPQLTTGKSPGSC